MKALAYKSWVTLQSSSSQSPYRVGHSTAHDEIVPMSIRKGKLSVQGEVSTFTGKLYIEFVKVVPLLCPRR